MSFILNFFGLSTKSLHDEEIVITNQNSNHVVPRAQIIKGGKNVFSKLPSELIQEILFKNDCDLVQLSKWRIVNKQFKQCIDETVFRAYMEFVSVCLNPNPTSGILSGNFIKKNALNFKINPAESSLFISNDNLFQREIEISWLFKENNPINSNNNQNDQLSTIKSINLIFHSKKDAKTETDYFLEKIISEILLQSKDFLQTEKTSVTLKGLSPSLKFVVRENTDRISQAIHNKAFSFYYATYSTASIWFNHETGLIEAISAEYRTPQYFDGVLKEDLDKRPCDGLIHYSIYYFKTIIGIKSFITWDFPQPANPDGWSKAAASAYKAFFDEPQRQQKKMANLETKYGPFTRERGLAGMSSTNQYFYTDNSIREGEYGFNSAK